ncbi:hypothetical protein [Streptomyces sp. NPDC057617]|uniref:hypothetical protein n=1 Tax=Streptomyces sp. NPDC057617 TaxID=3346184 RepID=UPI00369B9223
MAHEDVGQWITVDLWGLIADHPWWTGLIVVDGLSVLLVPGRILSFVFGADTYAADGMFVVPSGDAIEADTLTLLPPLAARRGCTLIDRRLYLPTSWTDDRKRCRQAGIYDWARVGARPWHRHMTLAMAAHACLTVLRARELDAQKAETDPPTEQTPLQY